MVTKKNIYHYLIYVVFALIFFCGIGLHSVSLANDAGNSAIILMLIRYAIVFVCAVLTVLLYKVLFPLIPEKYVNFKIPVISRMMELLGIVVICVLMIFFRIMFVTMHIDQEINDVIYNYILNAADKLPDTSMLTYMYASICKFIHNLIPSAYPLFVFNGLLEIGTGIFAYFAVKRLLRMRYGIAVFALIAFSPYSINAIYGIKPGILLAFLFSGYIYALVRISELNKNRKIEETYHVLFIVGLGVLSGFIASLDIIGVSLAVITVSFLLMIYNAEPWHKYQNRFVQSIIYLASFLGSAFIILCIMKNNGVGGMANVMNYVYSFIPDGLSLSYNPPMEGRIEGIVLFVFAAISIFTFIRNEYDKGLIYVLIVDFAAVFTFVNFNSSDYSYLVNFAYIVIAVIGLFEVPTFILTDEQIYERDKERQKREAHRRQKEYERNLAKGKGVLSLADVGKSPVEEPEEKDTNAKVVAAPPVIPDAYKNAGEQASGSESGEGDNLFGRRQRPIISLGVNSSSAASRKDTKKEDTQEEKTDIAGNVSDNDSVKTIDESKETIAEIKTDENGRKDVSSALDKVESVKNGKSEDKEGNAVSEASEENAVSETDSKASDTENDKQQITESNASAPDSEDNKGEESTETTAFNETDVNNTVSDNMVHNPVYDGLFTKSVIHGYDKYSSPSVNIENVSDSGENTANTNIDKNGNVIIDSDLLDQNNILTSDLQKRDKILPSRRDYKTAHVYKSKEEEELLSGRKDNNESSAPVTVDPALKATPLIKNPLPVPKAHVPKELTYDYELKDDELDFDITDLKGKDYYDI